MYAHNLTKHFIFTFTKSLFRLTPATFLRLSQLSVAFGSLTMAAMRFSC